MDLTRLRIVLHEPRSPENLGAVARAMKNAGLSRLILVNPQTREFDLARHVAVDSEDVLDRMSVLPDLGEAVGRTVLVAGTTSRPIEGRPAWGPRRLAEEAARATAVGEVAVVFGSERRGLSNAELDRCQAVVTIPTAPEKASINLAQAVAIVGYELWCHPAEVPAPVPEPPRATAEALERLYERLRAVLLDAGFLNPQNPDLVFGEMKRFVERARPTPREAELWLAAVKQIDRAQRR